MKRLLYFLLSLIFLPLSAETVQKSYTYYFNNPVSLHPSITRSPYEGGSVSVTDVVFSSEAAPVSDGAGDEGRHPLRPRRRSRLHQDAE